MGRNHLQEQQVPKDPTIYSPGHATQRDHRVLASVSRGYPRLKGSLITSYSPVRHFTRLATFTCDLHASSTPPTFVLSQDQTLHLKCWVHPVSTNGFRRWWLATPVLLAQHRAASFAHTLDFEATRYAKDRRTNAERRSLARAAAGSCGARKGSEGASTVKQPWRKTDAPAQPCRARLRRTLGAGSRGTGPGCAALAAFQRRLGPPGHGMPRAARRLAPAAKSQRGPSVRIANLDLRLARQQTEQLLDVGIEHADAARRRLRADRLRHRRAVRAEP